MPLDVQQLPVIDLRLDGASVMVDLGSDLTAIRVAQVLSAPAQCEVVVTDRHEGSHGSRFRLGQPIQVFVGIDHTELFSGEVTAITHTYQSNRTRECRVRAYDLLHRLRKRQSVRSFSNVTAVDLANQLTADLTVTVLASTQPAAWPWLIQHRQSDLALLQEICGRCGMYFSLRPPELHLCSLEGIGAPIELRLGRELLEASLELNGDSATRRIHASGWDTSLTSVFAGSAAQPRSGRPASGAIPSNAFDTTGDWWILNVPAADDDLASALAQAELDLRGGHELVFMGIAEGDPRLRPATRVDIQGVDDPLSGQYVMSEVVHEINTQVGYVCQLSSAPPLHPLPASVAFVTLGEVIAIDDPERLGRVRVKLLALNEVETQWIAVMTAGAAKGKGLMVLPDRGDRVLVLCAHGDPAQGLVLGGVFGPDRPEDDGVDSGARRRMVWRSAEDQAITLDDDRHLIRLETNKGTRITLSDDQLEVFSATDLKISAPGRSIEISGRTIDFLQVE